MEYIHDMVEYMYNIPERLEGATDVNLQMGSGADDGNNNATFPLKQLHLHFEPYWVKIPKTNARGVKVGLRFNGVSTPCFYSRSNARALSNTNKIRIFYI